MPVRGFHPLRPDFPARSGSSLAALKRSYYPGRALTPPVWALSLSIATTQDIDVSFFSCRYLDVSVPCVRPGYSPVSGLQPDGLPHSESSGSLPVCSSPEIFAAYHVLPRLQKPRHPPSALISFFSSTRTALLWSPGPFRPRCPFPHGTVKLSYSDLFFFYLVICFQYCQTTFRNRCRPSRCRILQKDRKDS